MPTNDVVSKYYSGQGVVMIADRDPTTGKAKGFVPVGNVSDLKISISTSVLEHKEAQSGQRAIDLRLTTETKCALSMTMESFSKENLAIALRGTAVSVPGATATDEAGYQGFFGRIGALDHAKISAVTLKSQTVALTPYTNSTTPWDYSLNTEAGSYTINDGSVQLFDKLGENGALVVTDVTEGATTTVVCTNTGGNPVVAGMRVVIGGCTGTDAADINDKMFVVTSANASGFVIPLNTSVKTITAGTGKVFKEGDALTATYTYAAQEQTEALNGANTERYLRFEGLNTADNNKPVVVEVFKFSTDPLKELALIGDAIGQFVLEGNVLSDSLRATGSKFFKQVSVS